MTTSSGEWNVLSHGPIEKLAENLWRVEGALPKMSLRRVMTVARMRDGRLVIHSAIALEENAMRELESWGTPAFLIVPNAYHRLDAPLYKRRYPNIRVFAPKGGRKKVEQVIAVDATCDEFPKDDDSICFEALHGINEYEDVMIVRSADGLTVVVTDAIFNMDRKKDVLGFLFTSVLGSAPGPRVSRLFKAVAVKDKNRFRSDIERLAQLPDLTRLIVGHEKVAAGRDASLALQKAATFV